MAVNLPREAALKALYEINENNAYSNISLNKYLEEYSLKEVDKALVTDLVYGTVNWKLSIDWIIGQFSKIKLKKMSPWIRNILRMGVYQIIYTDRIPVSAACNESVILAKRYGHSASSGFVNGVLRSVARNKDTLIFPDRNTLPADHLSLKYSYPKWLVEEWIGRFGTDFTEDMLIENSRIPDFTIRINTLLTTKKELASKLKEGGYEVLEGRYLEDALVVKNPSGITKTDVYKEGYFQIQDESSMLVSIILDPKPGETIIDVCSAPGGKSAYIAQLMKNNGTVLSRDIHNHKIKLIDETAKRLKLNIIKPEQYDAVNVDERYIGKADRVLVDAPCTGFGIIRRKPDIKWARTKKDKAEIIDLQTKILDSSSKYVKSGGILVYSTCTIEREENLDVVEEFLRKNTDFQFAGISEYLPGFLRESADNNGYIQLYPNIHKTDGFFIVKLVKRRQDGK